ncbi:putative F420-dependent oxidoreductase [Actinocorallia herbida]|uniref:Putative F420-dependent oxidoreductase n=1 Tax=Actinocorallia herbida TaxID=58109 RepID=A0A3N1CXD2_9ACTN|nr:LLM class flavin-dependent oxidoreductase [Actinocorallia herbida]ROO85906.1 putative F420-dependent oxidoreductase [Actinocorallia herbida]
MADDRVVLGAAAIPEPDRDWLAAVERLPIASVWQGGHVLPPSATGEAITRLALMTAWTERVRVGTAVLMLPLYHPVLAAKQLADLDSRSGGRVVAGVGIGGEFPQEFAAMGVPVKERGARADEAIDVLRKLWRGGPVSHGGRFFAFDDVDLRPVRHGAGPGMRPGGPPLVVSGRKEPAMRRAARRGDGWMPYLVSPEAYARSVQTIRDEADAVGRDLTGFEWTVYLYCSVRADRERARADVAGFLGSAYGDKPPELLDRIAPSGTPEEVAARVQAYVDAGARHIVISPAAKEDTLGIVRLAAEEVLPRLSVPAAAVPGASA